MVLWREQRNTTEIVRDRYKAFSEEETGEKKQKVKEYGKNTEKLCPKKTNKERMNTWKTGEKIIQAMC